MSKKRKNKIPKTVKRLYNAAYEIKKELNKNLPEGMKIKKLEGYREALRAKKPRTKAAAKKLILDYIQSSQSKQYAGISKQTLRQKLWEAAPDYNGSPTTGASLQGYLKDLYEADDYEDTMSLTDAMSEVKKLSQILSGLDPQGDEYRVLNSLAIEILQSYTIKKGKKK